MLPFVQFALGGVIMQGFAKERLSLVMVATVIQQMVWWWYNIRQHRLTDEHVRFAAGYYAFGSTAGAAAAVFIGWMV